MILLTYWAILSLLVYTYVGYPLSLWLLARCVGARRVAAISEPSVTLIVPAYNEAAIIRRSIESLLALDYPSSLLDVIVVDDGSTDETAEIARAFQSASLQVVRHNTRRGKASAINTGVSSATGSLVCFCDANVRLCRDALKRLVARSAERDVGAVTSRVLLDNSESDFGSGEELYYRIESWIQDNEERLGSVTCVDGGMYLVKIDLLQPLPTDTILDDFTISARVIRQGYRIRYERKAVAHETGTPTGSQEFNRRVRLAAGCIQALRRGLAPSWRRPVLFWQFVSHKALRWSGPLLLLGLFVTNALITRQGTFYAATLVGQIAFYGCGALGRQSLRFRQTWLGGVAYYFTLSQCAMGIGLINGVMNRQSVAWAKADRGPSSVASVDNVAGESIG